MPRQQLQLEFNGILAVSPRGSPSPLGQLWFAGT